ncbi:DUF2059 domain-containing protein [Prosthecobacter sp.]|jgi:hypothetical protein|uniref:DUF2059 domain-containing protein n=1 Tax=Prosthecobacter sp. TaxID=1965333 RepID=UPI0037C57544
MKNILTLATFALCLTTARADLTASHQAAIEKLVVALQVQKQFESNLILGFEAGMGGTSDQIKAMPPAMQQKFATGMEKVKTAILEQMGWAKLKPEIVVIYGKNFTEQEAKDVTALMESPAGQLLLGKQLKVTADLMKETQEKMKVLQPQIMQIMQAEMTKQ